jgi:divalent metal cation (Fe/Co/Zn/Cd) transporter
VITNATSADRDALIRHALLIEYVTLVWLAIEATVPIAAGISANSLVLIAFGIDSVIEFLSASVLVWRLKVECRGQRFAEAAERRAARIGGALLFALAAYIVASAGWKLWAQEGAEFSLPGLIVSILAIPVMYVLSRRKFRLADALQSHALRADAVESVTCIWLSLAVIIALVAQLILDAWWVDPVASLGIVWFIVREAREAWEGKDCDA